MSNSAWFRFATSEGTILGEVCVPTRPPTWFRPFLEAKKAEMSRDPSMDDVTPEEYLECCYSSRRPILLRRPLAPQQQEELVFFRPGDLNRMQAALKKHEDEQKAIPDEAARIPVQMLLRDNAFVGKYCIFMDQLERLRPEEREELRPVPRSKVQPGYQGRVFVVYQPLIQADASPAEDRDSMRMGWDRVNHFVVIKADPNFLRQADRAYSDEASQLVVAPAGSVPAERASPASPASRPTPIKATA